MPGWLHASDVTLPRSRILGRIFTNVTELAHRDLGRGLKKTRTSIPFNQQNLLDKFHSVYRDEAMTQCVDEWAPGMRADVIQSS